VKLVYSWLRDLVDVPEDATGVAATLGLRGFEVASIEGGAEPVIDFEITANRPDCLSVIGLAREASAAYGTPLRVPPASAVDAPASAQPDVAVTIDDADLCPRYCAQVFEVTVGPSPDWLRARLEAAGVRSISNVVDVTNYVMLESGQPTHAFDLERLAGRRLRIRRATPGERLRTLDGVDRTFEPDMLVIADGERAQAVAGVMGGADSEIGSATRVMVLESAYFAAASVRRTSKRLGLKTEASIRFERGADVEAAPAAIRRIAALLGEMGAAKPRGALIDCYPSPWQPIALTLRASRIARVLGMDIPDADVPRILRPLGFGAEPAGQGVWTVTVPSFRVDVQREIDLIEELARHDGYVSLPATFPPLEEPQAAPDARAVRDGIVRHVLTACGLSEAMTFAFIERAAAEPFAVDGEPAALANPLSEKYAVLRPSLLPGLIDAAAHNRRRERKDIRLFECGSRFTAAGERRAVAAVWTGAGEPAQWSGKGRPADFYDIKGVAEALCSRLGIPVSFEPLVRPYFAEGRAAAVVVGVGNGAGGARLGEVGQIAADVVEARGLPRGEPVFAFEIDIDAAAAHEPAGDLRAAPLPRFPSIVRDLSILIDASLPAATVRGTIRGAAPATLQSVAEFDRYRGQGVPEGRVSLSLRLTFRSPERTLTDAEVDAAMNEIVSALASVHQAVRR
jgi:phenylalanyl-tRNA synthetase beta chain